MINITIKERKQNHYLILLRYCPL